ncbi:efflux transporter outer membrane subunit [Luteolibacter marinus]|uniref:efflux transporter outer membrane subunit n=1 Tax=Luteolibacter marinus TaxID=2776705 RepID=UPI0018677EA9|nr:efflux transporter outer membrane subunit [Luteolibacter marinus]
MKSSRIPGFHPLSLGFALTGVAFVLGSCSLDPELGTVSSPVSANFPGNSGGEVPADIAWQKFFTDPRLEKIVATALANNRDLRVAALNVEQARAQYGISRSQLFPAVELGGSGVRQRTGGSSATGGKALETRAYDVSVGLVSYELDLFGRVRSMNTSALEGYFATDAARTGVQISLVAEVANQYLTERALQEQIELSRQTLDTFSETYTLMKGRYDAGDVSELDLRSVEVQVQTAKSNLASYRQQVAQVNNALAFLAGGSLPSGLPAGRSLDRALVADVRAGVSSDLLQRRPDIREAEHQLRAANANIGAARAAFFPRVTLTAGGGVASGSLSKLFSDGTGIWSFAPQVSVPIFDGGRNKANLESAEIGKRMEIARYEKAIQTGFREVADGLAARRGLAERIEANAALVKAQQTRFELADARYKEGLDSYFEVLSAQQDLYNAQQALIQLRLAREVNSVNLYKALGGGW